MTAATLTAPAHLPMWSMGDLQDKDLTTAEALEASGLNWTVTKRPLMVPAGFDGDNPVGGMKRMPGRFEIRRDDINLVTGVVGKTWEPTQNHEGFQLVDDLLQLAGANGTAARIVTGLEFDDRKKVLLMVELDAGLQIAGEAYRSYLTFMNGHDGRTSVTAFAHDSRFVCSNGQVGGLVEAGKTGYIVRVRHTKNAADRIKAAIHTLGMRNKQLEALSLEGEHMAEQTLSDTEFEKFLASLMPITDETTAPHATMTTDRREKIASVYMTAPNLEGLRGTRWGALQAVAEYADHGREFKTPDTAIKAQLGLTRPTLKFDALSILRDKKLRPLVAA